MIDSVNMSFLWIDNLNVADPIYVLPVLAALFTFITQKFTMANSTMNPDDPNAKTQKIMLYMMPIMIGYISIKMPAGVALYWVVQNVFTFFQQFIMMRIPEPEISPEEAERRVQEAEKERKADLAARRSGPGQTDNQKDKPERKEPLTKPATKKKIKSNPNENRKKPISEIPERDEDKE
jgi:YidC/Oxa1 family membrane protein insertase